MVKQGMILVKQGARLWNFMAKFMRGILKMENEYYNEGWEAYYLNHSMLDNPYMQGTFAYGQWEMGWTYAYNNNSMQGRHYI